MKFKVRIFQPDGEIIPGMLMYTANGPEITSIDGTTVDSDRKSVVFSFTEESIEKIPLIGLKDRVQLHSDTYYRIMDRSNLKQQDYYPPSTRAWATYLSRQGSQTRIELHRILNEDRFLLVCFDLDKNDIVLIHPINSFESKILSMEGDWEYWNTALDTTTEEEIPIENLLDAPAPSLQSLDSLKQGVGIPNLQRYETVGETLSQFVPTTFPEDVRKEIMVFLAWTLRATVPKEDPLDFLSSINKRFKSGPWLKSLVVGHVQCLIQGIPPPEYVRIFTLAERGSLTSGVKPQSEAGEQESWNKVWYSLNEIFPNRHKRVLEIADKLNQNQEIHTSLPISKIDAINSKDAWLDRFSLIQSNLLLRGYIQDNRIGLEKLVYFGSAHRWPHTHLQYAARLGHPNQKPPYIQVMIMPKTAVDRIKRIRKNIYSIDWTASRLNFNLYNEDNNSWKYNQSHFVKSFKSNKTIKQLSREFFTSTSKELIKVDENDARLLDLLSWGLVHHLYERNNYNQILESMTDAEIKDRIGDYVKEEITQLQYLPMTSGLASICFKINGPISNLYSIARAALKHLPSATVMISSDEALCIIMARVPVKDMYYILADLPKEVKDFGITMNVYRVTAFAGYVHNLYQRLRKPDGTWDDDISGLLNQITN